jgi:Cu-processing system permease protein
VNAVLAVAGKEIRDGLRNRWVLAATGLLAALALGLAFLGSAPTGTVGAAPLAVTVVSLASLSVFLLPLIALLISFDTIVGEQERGTLLLLLAYPVSRWQVLAGKFVGHTAILAFATVCGYGAAGLVVAVSGGAEAASWLAFAVLLGSSVMLGAIFVGIGYAISAWVGERGTAAGVAVAVWLLFVLLFDLALLGVLVADQGQTLSSSVFRGLLLLNPTDAYRLLNLSSFQEVREFSGLAGLPAEARPPLPLLLGALGLWLVLPLSLAAGLFSRKEL